MTKIFWALLILGITALAACGDDDSSGDDGGERSLRVVTTLPLFADMVSAVAGDGVEVTTLFPAGADPHTFEPPPNDVATIERADLIVMNGLHLEPSAENLIVANAGSTPIVRLAEEAVAAGAAVSEGDDEEPEGNPHLWLSVDNATLYVDSILDALIAVDPANVAGYESRAATYRSALDDTGAYVEDTVSTVPDQNRKLITTHDAFPYFAGYIRFAITAYLVESPGQEASTAAIREIVEAVEDSGVPAVFTEPQLGGDTNILDQVASDTGAEVCTLYSDALDDDVQTYIEMMRFNADEIARCLGGADGS